jgi:hypothetical protein
MSAAQHDLRVFLGSAIEFTIVGSKMVKMQSSR